MSTTAWLNKGTFDIRFRVDDVFKKLHNYNWVQYYPYYDYNSLDCEKADEDCVAFIFGIPVHIRSTICFRVYYAMATEGIGGSLLTNKLLITIVVVVHHLIYFIAINTQRRLKTWSIRYCIWYPGKHIDISFAQRNNSEIFVLFMSFK